MELAHGERWRHGGSYLFLLLALIGDGFAHQSGGAGSGVTVYGRSGVTQAFKKTSSLVADHTANRPSGNRFGHS